MEIDNDAAAALPHTDVSAQPSTNSNVAGNAGSSVTDVDENKNPGASATEASNANECTSANESANAGAMPQTKTTETEDAKANGDNAESGHSNKRSAPRHNDGRPMRKRLDEGRKFMNPNRKRYGDGIVSRYDQLPETADHGEIRQQVEFYFSDSNLPVDTYMFKLTGGHKNTPVPLQTIHTFSRMKRFQPYEAVREAVSKSELLDLSDKDEITRKEPLDSKYTSNIDDNRALLLDQSERASIYAKGFGDEKSSTQIDIEAFFEPYGPLKSVRLRRTQFGNFKRSVFVEFADEAAQQRFLALKDKPKWEGKELLIMSTKEYTKKKNDEMIERRANEGKTGSESRGSKNLDKDDWKSRRDHDQRKDSHRGSGRGNRGRGGRGRGRGRGGRGDRYPNSRGDRNEEANSRKREREDDEGEDREDPPAKKQAQEDDVAA